VRRSVLLVTALAVVLGGASACSGGSAVAGDPTGVPAGNSTTTTSKGTTPSTSTGSTNPLAGKDPCSLLTPSAKATLGVSGGEKSNAGSSRGCKWQLRAASGDLNLFAIDILDRQGIKDLPPAAKQLADVGTHKAAQTSGNGGPGSCSVIMGVGDKSRVESTVVAGTDTQKACDLALQMAKLVEPELPS
jgi:hypothetical protein